jgi:hypothetical protein
MLRIQDPAGARRWMPFRGDSLPKKLQKGTDMMRPRPDDEEVLVLDVREEDEEFDDDLDDQEEDDEEEDDDFDEPEADEEDLDHEEEDEEDL